MSDSPELAAIRARDAEDYETGLDVAGWDRRTLLRMLDEALKERDEAREAFDALNLLTRESADQLRQERDEARAENERLHMEMTAYREKLTPADKGHTAICPAR